MAYSWTLTVQASPPNGGTISADIYADASEDFATLAMPTITVTPRAVCGWSLDFCSTVLEDLDTGRTVSITPGVPSPEVLRLRYPGSRVAMTCTAYFTYNGSGKLMRSSLQPSKLIRVGDKLLRDA